MKKAFGDVIILNLCNKKHDHMIYAYSDMECSHRLNFLSFPVIFCSYAPLLTLKIKIWKNCKMEILSFYTHLPLIKIICTLDMMYGSWDMNFNRQNHFVILGHLLPFTPLTSSKMKISKMEKNPGDIITLHKCTKKSWSSAILFQRCGAGQR